MRATKALAFTSDLGYAVTAPAHTLYGTIAHTEMHKQLR